MKYIHRKEKSRGGSVSEIPTRVWFTGGRGEGEIRGWGVGRGGDRVWRCVIFLFRFGRFRIGRVRNALFPVWFLFCFSVVVLSGSGLPGSVSRLVFVYVFWFGLAGFGLVGFGLRCFQVRFCIVDVFWF